jgi:hypothetical protein
VGGESRSPVWFDVARELTERWHHSADPRCRRCRAADDPRVLHPVLDTFMRALPSRQPCRPADDGRLEGRDHWPCRRRVVPDRKADRWQLVVDAKGSPDATATLADDDAWRLFTKGSTGPGAHLPHVGGNRRRRGCAGMRCIVVEATKKTATKTRNIEEALSRS